jgi:hypothetical protein
MEETRGRRINHIRLEQTMAGEPDRIATACPYCLMMFEDATGAKGVSDTLPVQDVAELVEASLPDGRDAGSEVRGLGLGYGGGASPDSQPPASNP